MSKHDALYIQAFQPIHPRDPAAPRTFERSECCKAFVVHLRTISGETSPPEPYDVCAKCGRRCDTIEITENEEEMGE